MVYAWNRLKNRKSLKSGAGNQVRTGDLNLGKVALYQLSYSRKRAEILASNRQLSSQISDVADDERPGCPQVNDH